MTALKEKIDREFELQCKKEGEIKGDIDDIWEHLPKLYEIAKEIKNCQVLEFGTSFGHSTIAFLKACIENDGHLTSIDIRECEVIRNFIGSCKNWTFMQGDSKEFSSVKKFDVCLIDSLHTYFQVKYECEVLDKLIKPESIIIFHDTERDFQIVKAINEFISRHRCFVEKYANCNGMWIVYLQEKIYQNDLIYLQDEIIEDNLFHEVYERIENITLLDKERCYLLYQLANYCKNLDGEFSECGVYKGGSAFVLANALRSNKKLHLFDTFSGMPEIANQDPAPHSKGDFNTNLKCVRKLFYGYNKIIFYPGEIPKIFTMAHNIYSLVHIDVDLYQTTKDCLEFFYGKVVPGGIMILDDYGFPSYVNSAKRAVDDFFKDKKEKPILLPTKQAMVIKCQK